MLSLLTMSIYFRLVDELLGKDFRELITLSVIDTWSVFFIIKQSEFEVALKVLLVTDTSVATTN